MTANPGGGDYVPETSFGCLPSLGDPCGRCHRCSGEMGDTPTTETDAGNMDNQGTELDRLRAENQRLREQLAERDTMRHNLDQRP
jgi:hypothetical protein